MNVQNYIVIKFHCRIKLDKQNAYPIANALYTGMKMAKCQVNLMKIVKEY